MIDPLILLNELPLLAGDAEVIHLQVRYGNHFLPECKSTKRRVSQALPWTRLSQPSE
jgi:hypothetical protein